MTRQIGTPPGGRFGLLRRLRRPGLLPLHAPVLETATPEVLHYVGYDEDGGGIVSVVRALQGAGRFACVLGVNRGARQHREPPLPVLELPQVDGEEISLRHFWRARPVAQKVRVWLQADARRIFHGHSRAGLLVALWLQWFGERRVVVSVHCYGRQRWFYRWAARRLGRRLYWLSPAMRNYYGAPGIQWEQCTPGGVPWSSITPAQPVPDRLRLGGIGARVRWKGWHHVIAALTLLPADLRSRVTFNHIGGGDGGCVADLAAQAEASGCASQVVFRGVEPTSDALLGEIDALVVASANEPFSMAVLEALAAGVPVLAADSGGALDLIQPGVNGTFYRTGDATALAAQLRQWLEQRPAWDRAKIRATSMGIGQIADRWAKVYAAL